MNEEAYFGEQPFVVGERLTEAPDSEEVVRRHPTPTRSPSRLHYSTIH
jgi:hypothetical protein